MTIIKQKICKECKCKFTPIRSTLERFCSFECMTKFNKENPKENKIHRIPQVSEKRKIEQLKYSVLRTEFLGKPENKICFIDGCNRKSNTIEHRAGRWGKNYLDTTTWAGCCSEHNIELENNPELAKKYQLSKIHGGSKL